MKLEEIDTTTNTSTDKLMSPDDIESKDLGDVGFQNANSAIYYNKDGKWLLYLMKKIDPAFKMKIEALL